MGPATAISKNDKDMLELFLISTAKKGFPVSKRRLLLLAQEVSRSKLGRKWFELFMKTEEAPENHKKTRGNNKRISILCYGEWLRWWCIWKTSTSHTSQRTSQFTRFSNKSINCSKCRRIPSYATIHMRRHCQASLIGSIYTHIYIFPLIKLNEIFRKVFLIWAVSRS